MLKAKSYHKSGIPDVLQLQTFPFFNLMWRVWLECFAKHFFEVWSPLSPNSFQEYLWCSGIAVLIDCMGCNFNFMWLCDINGHNRWSHVTCFFLFSECIFLYFLSDFSSSAPLSQRAGGLWTFGCLWSWGCHRCGWWRDTASVSTEISKFWMF